MARRRLDRFAEDRFIPMQYSRKLDDGINKMKAQQAKMSFCFNGKCVRGNPVRNRSTSGTMKSLCSLHAIIICRSDTYNGWLREKGVSRRIADKTSSHVFQNMLISRCSIAVVGLAQLLMLLV